MIKYRILAIAIALLFIPQVLAYNEAEHKAYLEQLREQSMKEESRMIRGGDMDGFPSLTQAPAGTIGFRVSQDFINKIIQTYLGDNPKVQDLQVLFLMDKVAVDGKYRFVNETYEIDLLIPFTVESKTSLSTDDGETILIDIHKILLWEDCHLPTDKLLEAVIKYVNASELGQEYVKIEYEKLNFQGSPSSTPYESYGRVRITPTIQGSLPVMPKITLLNVGVRNHEMKVVGQ